MEKHQTKLIELITTEVAGVVTEIKIDDISRYFLGVVQTPTKEDDFALLEGYELTHFFKDALIKKESDDVKLDILKYCNEAQTIRIKFSSNIPWLCYSKI